MRTRDPGRERDGCGTVRIERSSIRTTTSKPRGASRTDRTVPQVADVHPVFAPSAFSATRREAPRDPSAPISVNWTVAREAAGIASTG